MDCAGVAGRSDSHQNTDRKVETHPEIDGPLEAPIAAGTIVGRLDLYDDGQKLGAGWVVASLVGCDASVFY
ncbi:hypothetical protein [Pseudomonas fluorescens]|uniref:hypothetical protein n=1 Tax=Pseudomonas fluorescens TaxID=294 RepID=UPI001CD6FAAD|nr:hypothetical protein [Pseudomonas fluorescens]